MRLFKTFKFNKMKQILNERNQVIFEGDDSEMELAFNYLTKPFYILAESMGLRMFDAYELNEKYWNDKTRMAKSFKLVDNNVPFRIRQTQLT